MKLSQSVNARLNIKAYSANSSMSHATKRTAKMAQTATKSMTKLFATAYPDIKAIYVRQRYKLIFVPAHHALRMRPVSIEMTTTSVYARTEQWERDVIYSHATTIHVR